LRHVPHAPGRQVKGINESCVEKVTRLVTPRGFSAASSRIDWSGHRSAFFMKFGLSRHWPKIPGHGSCVLIMDRASIGHDSKPPIYAETRNCASVQRRARKGSRNELSVLANRIVLGLTPPCSANTSTWRAQPTRLAMNATAPEHHALETLPAPAPESLIARVALKLRTSSRPAEFASALHPTESGRSFFECCARCIPAVSNLALGALPEAADLEAVALHVIAASDWKRRPPSNVTDFCVFLHHDSAEHPLQPYKSVAGNPGAPEVWPSLARRLSADAASSGYRMPSHILGPEQPVSALAHYQRELQVRRNSRKSRDPFSRGLSVCRTPKPKAED